MNQTTIPQYAAGATADLQQRIGRVYDHLYANSPVRTPQGIAVEVGKILHTAMFIEESRPRLFSDVDAFPAFSFERSELKRLARGDESICQVVATELREHFIEMNTSWHLYEAGTALLLRDADIAYTCGQLSDVVVSDRGRDVFGDALEIFRSQWAKREGGQFFTDQKVTSLAMTLLDFDPRRGDDLVDICAGTGGFLLAGLNHVRKLLDEDNGYPLSETELVKIAATSIKGQEVDSQVCEIGNATLTSRLSMVKHPFIRVGDSLQVRAFAEPSSVIHYDSHLCAATNPPFGSKTTIKDETLLQHYDLARTGGYVTSLGYIGRLSTRAPEILFVEQNVRILKPGLGRLAIVVPYQILSGPQTLYVREWILRNTEILAVIDLPADTFQPHTGTKAALLVVRRREEPLHDLKSIEDHMVFMSIPKWIGHDRRGNPVYKRAEDGELTGEVLSDFGTVAEAFRAYQRGIDPSLVHAQSFTISVSRILGDPNLRLNALFHRPSQAYVRDHETDRSTGINGPIKITSVRVGDVVERLFCPTRFKRNYVDYYPGAVPFLGGSNISQLIVTADKWLRHNDPKLEELKVHTGWILVTRSGSTGIISTVPEAWDGFAISEHVIRIVPNPTKLDPVYLYAFLRTKYAQEILSRGIFGSVIDEITPEFVGDIKIPIPESSELLQRVTEKTRAAERAREIAIDSLLEAVDELNRWLTK